MHCALKVVKVFYEINRHFEQRATQLRTRRRCEAKSILRNLAG